MPRAPRRPKDRQLQEQIQYVRWQSEAVWAMSVKACPVLAQARQKRHLPPPQRRPVRDPETSLLAGAGPAADTGGWHQVPPAPVLPQVPPAPVLHTPPAPRNASFRRVSLVTSPQGPPGYVDASPPPQAARRGPPGDGPRGPVPSHAGRCRRLPPGDDAPEVGVRLAQEHVVVIPPLPPPPDPRASLGGRTTSFTAEGNSSRGTAGIVAPGCSTSSSTSSPRNSATQRPSGAGGNSSRGTAGGNSSRGTAGIVAPGCSTSSSTSSPRNSPTQRPSGAGGNSSLGAAGIVAPGCSTSSSTSSPCNSLDQRPSGDALGSFHGNRWLSFAPLAS